MSTRRWVICVNVMLGLWLITSPLHLTLATSDGAAAWNLWSVGVAILTLAGFAIYKPAIWGDVAGIVFGMWLIASPWMLQLSSLSTDTSAVIVGLLVMGYALWAMRIDITTQRYWELGAPSTLEALSSRST